MKTVVFEVDLIAIDKDIVWEQLFKRTEMVFVEEGTCVDLYELRFTDKMMTFQAWSK